VWPEIGHKKRQRAVASNRLDVIGDRARCETKKGLGGMICFLEDSKDMDGIIELDVNRNENFDPIRARGETVLKNF
jgi:hypothetical protein